MNMQGTRDDARRLLDEIVLLKTPRRRRVSPINVGISFFTWDLLRVCSFAFKAILKKKNVLEHESTQKHKINPWLLFQATYRQKMKA